MANARLHNEAIQAKNDLKKSFQHKIQQSQAFQIHSIPLQHEISEDTDTEITPMPSPCSSLLPEPEPEPERSPTPLQSPSSSSTPEPTITENRKKCFQCSRSFDSFENRKQRMKHVRNCKRSKGRLDENRISNY